MPTSSQPWTATEPVAPAATDAPELRAPGARERLASEALHAGPASWFARVVDDETEAPIEGAQLIHGVRRAPEKSNREGRFPPIARGGSAKIRHRDFVEARVTLDRGHATRATEAVIRLERGGRLEVLVRDGQGRPGVGLTLRIANNWSDPFGQATDGLPSRTLTDASGHGSLTGLPSGRDLSLALERDGKVQARHPETIRLDRGETREIEWVYPPLGTGCLVAGLVLETNGLPAEGLEVWLGSQSRIGGMMRHRGRVDAIRRTDAAGRFLFEDVPPSDWLVGLAPGQEGVPPHQLSLEIFTGEKRRDVTLRVERGLAIRGRVVGPRDEPVMGCRVTGTCHEPYVICESESRGDGSFTLEPLMGGSYRIEAEPSDESGFLIAGDALEVPAGAEDVVIRLGSGGTLHAQVLSGENRASRRARVSLLPEDLSRPIAHYLNEGRGRFVFENVVPGRYHLVASTESGELGWSAALVVDADTSQQVELLVQPAAKVVVRLPGESDLVQVELSAGGVVLAREWLDGTEQTELVAPVGASVFRVYSERGDERRLLQELTLDLRVGERRRIDLLPAPRER